MTDCEYCSSKSNDFKQLNSTTEYSGIEIAFHHSGMLRVRVFAGDCIRNQDVITLPVCPMCGRALKGGE